jgi:vacuolar-type H+-ATPase subunit I/STV1
MVRQLIKGNSLGASGFTLGILSILSVGIFGIIMSVIGFAFCFIQQKKKPTKLGKAGLILNIAGFVLSIFWVFYLGPIVLAKINAQFPTA